MKYPHRSRFCSVLFGFSVLTWMSFASIALAQEEDVFGPGPRFGQGGSFLGMFKELGLTPKQKEILSEKQVNHRKMMIDKQAALEKELDAFQELMKKDKDGKEEKALRAQFQRVHEIKCEMGSLRFEHLLDMRKELTPEQRQKFADFPDRIWPRKGRRDFCSQGGPCRRF